MKKLIEFKTMTDNRGNDTFEQFLQTLDKKQMTNVLALIEKIEYKGLQVAIRMKWVKNWIKTYMRSERSSGRITKGCSIFRK